MLQRLKSKFLILVISILAIGIGTARPVYAETRTVEFSYPTPSPKNITINVGDIVRFVGPSSFHPLEQVDGADSDTPLGGGFSATSSPFEVQFDSLGTFYYRCTNHGVAALNGTMRGSIIVVEGGAQTPTPTPTATPPSNCVSAKAGVRLVGPVLVKPVSGAKVNKSRVSLQWEGEDCATSYKVEVRKLKKRGTVVDRKTTTDLRYRTRDLTRATKYFWKVSSCDSSVCVGSEPSSFSVK